MSSPRVSGAREKPGSEAEPTLVWTVWGGASLPARDESPAAVDRRCPRTRHRCLGRHVYRPGIGHRWTRSSGRWFMAILTFVPVTTCQISTCSHRVQTRHPGPQFAVSGRHELL